MIFFPLSASSALLRWALSFKCGTNRCWFTLSVFLSRSRCMCLYFRCVSVPGSEPADLLLLLTASTSAPPDLGETVIVSASALNGSAGCFWSTQLVCVHLFFCQPPSCRGPAAKPGAFSALGSFPLLCLSTCPLVSGNTVHPLVSRPSSRIKLIPNALICGQKRSGAIIYCLVYVESDQHNS